MSVNPLAIFATKPTISDRTLWVRDNFGFHYRDDLPGELEFAGGLSHHLMTFFLTDNQRQITHFDGHGEYSGQMNAGEFYLCPAKVPGFTHWHEKDRTLHLIIEPNFLQQIAIATECLNYQQVELKPQLKNCDRQIEKIIQLLITEIESDRIGQQLYLESLADILGIHLLRNYGVFEPKLRTYSNGLSALKSNQTIEYIQAHLAENISLEVLAKNVGMSRYYFANQFKQAMGISPYRYVNQQRIEKAKQLLQNSSRAIAEIALECGFASQSHLNKVFRQHVGTTPKKYREQSKRHWVYIRESNE